MSVFVYKITNTATNKSYIGVTARCVKKRFVEHFQVANKSTNRNYWQNSLVKYGKQNFTISVLARVSSQDEAFELERKLIEEHNTLSPHGYNSTSGGHGGSLNPSDELRKRLSDAKLGYIPWNKGKGKYPPRIHSPRKTKIYTLKNTLHNTIHVIEGNRNLQQFCKDNNICFCVLFRQSKENFKPAQSSKNYYWSMMIS